MPPREKWPHQECGLDLAFDALDLLIKRILLVLPTGAGKTDMIAHVALDAFVIGKAVHIYVHRVELIRQISERLNMFGIPHGIVSPNHPFEPFQNIQIISVYSAKKRHEQLPVPFLQIFDEAHHMAASIWDNIQSWYPNAYKFGFTATPDRLDGKGLGRYFDKMIVVCQPLELIKTGFLVMPTYYSPDYDFDASGMRTSKGDFTRADMCEKLEGNKNIVGKTVEQYKDKCPNTKAIAFCVSVKAAEETAAQFNEAGIPAASIDGKMSDGQRQSILNSFSGDGIQVLTSCELVSEGFDLPSVGCAILLRPTQSRTLFLQSIGRAIRADKGKTQAFVLDQVGNYDRHLHPAMNRSWSLDGKEGLPAGVKEAVPANYRCKSCFLIFTTEAECPACGTPRQADNKRELKVVNGELMLVTLEMSEEEKARLAAIEEVEKARRREELKVAKRKCVTLADFQALAKERGYAPGWAYHQFQLETRMRAGRKKHSENAAKRRNA